METPKPIKYVVDRLSLGGWPDFAEAMVPDPPAGVPPEHFHAPVARPKAEAELEAETSARDASALCEQEEADRLRRRIGGLPVKHMQTLPHIAGNPFIRGERYDYE